MGFSLSVLESMDLLGATCSSGGAFQHCRRSVWKNAGICGFEKIGLGALPKLELAQIIVPPFHRSRSNLTKPHQKASSHQFWNFEKDMKGRKGSQRHRRWWSGQSNSHPLRQQAPWRFRGFGLKGLN